MYKCITQRMFRNLLRSLKVTMTFILFILFIIIFAKPSYVKWERGDVLVTKSIYEAGNILPAVTICPNNVCSW